MKPGRLMWPTFVAAVAVVVAAMGWTTAAVLRLDRRAALEENARLALWRMDSAIAPLVAEEQARPARSFFSEEGATPALAFLLGREVPFVSLRFESDGDGVVRFPMGKDSGEGPGIKGLRPKLPKELILATLPPDRDPPRLRDVAPEPSQQVAIAEPTPQQQQWARNSQEYQARVQSNMQQMANRAAYPGQAPPESDYQSALRPVWHDGSLYLIRRTGGHGADGRIQGCLIEWPTVRRQLLASCADLLPAADLQPVPSGTTDPDARLLASLPVRLVPGNLPAAGGAGLSPLCASLMVAWACVLAATGAVGLLLAGVASLSERRGAFVSAVTHELRTPLTTLRMYTEMLADGMVADPSQQRSYLQTLRAESDRLGHLVENVLAYSRLERNRAGYELSDLSLGDATGRTVERLAERAKQAGMSLRAEIPGEVATTRVRANALALEQILFNLVDNACKYAAGAADRTIEVTGSSDAEGIHLRVRDHGPGIAPPRAGRLFRPFKKSVQEAADSAPGLGLGLALSRRLARSMGGDLRVDRAVTDGAALVLSLRRA